MELKDCCLESEDGGEEGNWCRKCNLIYFRCEDCNEVCKFCYLTSCIPEDELRAFFRDELQKEEKVEIKLERNINRKDDWRIFSLSTENSIRMEKFHPDAYIEYMWKCEKCNKYFTSGPD